MRFWHRPQRPHWETQPAFKLNIPGIASQPLKWKFVRWAGARAESDQGDSECSGQGMKWLISYGRTLPGKELWDSVITDTQLVDVSLNLMVQVGH